tara:strand:- start:1376 stop:1540 length:165 start_codon:yes stop_codon:yes gene_type:complete
MKDQEKLIQVKQTIKYYQKNKEQFLIDIYGGDEKEREYLYNDWIEDFFLDTLKN